jgi:hypothetical protein
MHSETFPSFPLWWRNEISSLKKKVVLPCIYVQSNTVMTSWKGLNIVSLQKSVVITEAYNVMVNSEEVIGITEYLTL